LQAFLYYKMINSPYLIGKNHTLLRIKLGSMYLFDNYLVTEFNEGVVINHDNFREVAEIINKQFNNKPFGFIANRLNSYSIDLKDASKFNENFPNLKAYAVVVYSSLNEQFIETENHFFKFNREAFKTLDNAAEWVEKMLSIEA